jgi:hypothetical protein
MAVTRANVTASVTASQRQWANGASVTCDIVGTCCHCYACDGCYSQRRGPCEDLRVPVGEGVERQHERHQRET